MVVYAVNHPLPERYTVNSATLGFRVPENFPDAAPEDSFFIQVPAIELVQADTVRQTKVVNRLNATDGFLTGTSLADHRTWVFSWHLWEKSAWNRRKHKLLDHYLHCLRRFEAPEHD